MPGATVPSSPRGGTLPIGVRHADEASARAISAALGARNVSAGDTRGYAQAVIDHFNATGGIAGRRVVPHYLAVDLVGLVGNPDSSDQQSCSHFTEDQRVFAVVTGMPSGSVLPRCLASRGVPLIMQAPEEFDADNMRQYRGWFYLPGLPNMSRQQPTVVDGLHRQGFYKGVKLGLVWYDRPEFARVVARSLKPALAARGVRLTDEVAMSSYTSSEQYSSAVLRFKARGVTHVQFVDVSGLIAIQFMQYAESQAFRPRYGLYSGNSLNAVRASAPEAQLRRSLAVGWMPSLDVAAGQDPGATATGRECLDVIRAAGHQLGDRVAESLALWTCEVLYFLKFGLDRASAVTPAALRVSVEQAGTGYVPVSTFATRFGPGRFDGPSVARGLAYAERCRCFSYVGRPYPIE